MEAYLQQQEIEKKRLESLDRIGILEEIEMVKKKINSSVSPDKEKEKSLESFFAELSKQAIPWSSEVSKSLEKLAEDQINSLLPKGEEYESQEELEEKNKEIINQIFKLMFLLQLTE